MWIVSDSNNDPNFQQPTAVQINSSGGVYAYAIQPEHYSGPVINISNASNVYFRNVEFETGNNNWSSAQVNQISNSNNVSIAGVVTSDIVAPALFNVSSSSAGLWQLNLRNSSSMSLGMVSESSSGYGGTGANLILDGYIDYTGIPYTPGTLTTITFQTPGAPGTLSTIKQ